MEAFAIERFILIAITVLSLASILYIPKEQRRKALLAYVAFQATTWLTSITLAQLGSVEYPVREFQAATAVSFVPQFVFYPALFTWFILLFPAGRGWAVQAVHYFLFVSCMVFFIYFTFKYTNLYHFPGTTDFSMLANGYWRNFLQFAVCHFYITWFFKRQLPTEG